MHYFAHTRKACGPIAFALVLSACGEETAQSASQTAGQLDQADLAAVAQQDYERVSSSALQPAQHLVTAEFSTPGARAAAAINAGTAPHPVTFARGSTTSAPGAPVHAALDKLALADGTSVISRQGPAVKLPPGSPSRPGLDLGDQLPVEPPVADAGDEPAPAPISGEDAISAELELPPVVGADPMVTLIANTQGSLNTSGTKLEWSAENVDVCEASGAWEGQVNATGVRELQHETSGEHTYMITCRGSAGTAMAMVTVTVESTALAWQPPAQNTNGSELTDLAGYNLYYGSESGRYTQVRPVRDASQTALELPVEPGTYYLAMTAYDLSGNESELSNEVIRIVN